MENRDRQRSEDFVSGTSQFSGRERDNFHRSWLVLWHEMRLRRALLKESPPGGGPFPTGPRCSSVEGANLLHRCALPRGKMPRRAPSPGFAAGSQFVTNLSPRAVVRVKIRAFLAAYLLHNPFRERWLCDGARRGIRTPDQLCVREMCGWGRMGRGGTPRLRWPAVGLVGEEWWGSGRGVFLGVLWPAARPRRCSQRPLRCLTRRLTAGSPFGQPRGWLSRSARF